MYPVKSWWAGDGRVEQYMAPVRKAIRRHLPFGSQAATDIYNRAYEAVYEAVTDMDKQYEARNVLVERKDIN